MKNTAVFLILILCVTGCSGGYSEALSAVERQMQSEARPERAYEMLCSIPEGSLRSKDDKALYGLLLTELLIKTRRPVESDSLIDASIRHFWHSGDRQHLADGYIYKCRLDYNKKNYHDAMESALMAIHISEDIADTLRMARSNEFMADIYRNVVNSEKALHHRSIAAELYKKCGYRLNYYYALVEISSEYRSIGESRKAVELLDSIKFILNDSISTHWLKMYHHKSYILPLFYLKDYEGVKKRVKTLEENGSNSLSVNHCNIMSIIYSKELKIDSAKIYLSFCQEKCVNTIDSISLIEAQVELAKATKNYDDIINLTNLLDRLQTKTVWMVLGESIDDVKADYYKKQSRLSNKKEQRTRFIAISIAVICSFIFVIGYLVFKNRLYKKHLEIDRTFSEIRELTHKIKKAERERNELSARIEMGNNQVELLSNALKEKSLELEKNSGTLDKLFKKQFAMVDELCDEYYEKRDSEKVRLSLYAKLENVVHDMQSQESLMRLVDAVNECKGGIIDRLKSELPWLTSNDIIFISLLYTDFSPRSVCLFMGFKLSNYYAKRKRLLERIKASKAPSMALFIEMLS